MNILNLTNKGYSARFFAGITIVSLLLSAFPAAFFVANAANTDAVGDVELTVSPAPTGGASEYFEIEFTGTGTLNLDGWTVEDEAGLKHTFGAVSLTTGQSTKVCGDSGLSSGCDADIDAGGNSVWNNDGDTATLKDEAGTTVVVTTYTAISPADDSTYNNTGSVDYAPAGTVWNSTDDLYFATLQDAIDAATTGTGDVIELTADVTTTAQVTIDKAIMLDGNGFTLDADFFKATPSSNDNNSAIGVQSDDVTIVDIKVTSTGDLPWPKQLHGINVYESTGIELNDVTATEFHGSGVVVNSSEVTIEDIVTAANGWYAINVDQKTSEPAQLTIKNTSSHAEPSPIKPHIYIDDTSKDVTVIDTDSQYNFGDFGNARVYTLKSLPGYPCESTDTLENTTFDTFTLGDVDAQNGWSSTGSFDQEVVTNTYGYSDFGCQSLRVSNAVTSGSFGDQTFAAPIPDSVGETDATVGSFSEGARYNHFEIEFDIASAMPDAKQDGLALSVSPDRGDGSRMSYLSFADTDDGIAVTFYDTQGETNPAGFVATDLGDLDRSVPHNIKFVMDMNDGSDNDVVKIFIDGALAHTGGSWENYYRFDNEANAEQSPRIMKTLLMRAAGSAAPATDGAGFLFDNMSLKASVQEEPVVDPNDENQLTITAIKFHNRNSDNNRDSGEEALDGWEMRLYKEVSETEWSLVATGTTVAGQKKFPQQKEAGVYHICEVSQLGWTQVAPAEDTQTVNISPNAAEEEPYCTQTTYSDESDRSTKPEIGNVHNDLNDEHQLNISGEVYLDIAVDDCDNRSECLFSKTNTKLADWEMRLYKEVAGIWTEVATTTTNNDGIYRFPTQYEAGVYHTCEVLEAGYQQGIGNWNGSGYLVNTANLSGATDEGPYCNTYTYTDAADKSSKSHFGNAIVDTTSPTVTMKDSSITCETGTGYEKVDFKLKDLESGIDKVVLNGKEKDLTNNNYSDFNNVTPGNWTGAVEGINVLQVYDVAGNVTELTFTLCVGPDEESSAPTATVKTGDEFVKTCDDGYRMLSYKLRDEGGKIDRVVINGVEKDLTDNEWSDVNFLAPGVFGAQAGENTMVVYDTAGNNTTYTFFLCDALVTCEITSGPNTLIVENNEFAVATYVHRNWTADIANATWVWPTEYVQTPEQEETYTFEETFTVTDIDSATIEVAADNGYKVIVNGTEVMDRTNIGNNFGDHTVLPPIDISNELISGENTVQVVVTNNATANSNSRSNPAGALFKIIVNAENACEVTTAPVVENQGSLEITNPATDGLELADMATFTAMYQDADEDEDVVYWAIRAETCSGSDMVGNTPASPFHPSTYNSTTGLFETTVDMSAWSDGDYCLVVNPREDAPADDLRATRTFVLENSTSTEGEPDETPIVIDEDSDDDALSSRGGGSNATAQRFASSFASAPVGQVLGATTIDSCPFLLDYMQVGVENDSNEVRKLQMFLNIFKSMFGGTENPVTGVFGPITDANVKAFQEHYRSEVLDPWFERGIVPHNRPTGFVYKTTLYKINSIVCPDSATEPDLDGEDLTTNVDID